MAGNRTLSEHYDFSGMYHIFDQHREAGMLVFINIAYTLFIRKDLTTQRSCKGNMIISSSSMYCKTLNISTPLLFANLAMQYHLLTFMVTKMFIITHAQ